MVYIIVPAYNEEDNIGRVISGLFTHGYNQVVVIDDGSTDKTAEIAEQSGAQVLIHQINRGQGAALQTGNQYALFEKADMVVHFDADNQFDPLDISPAIKAMQESGAEIVLGSRFLSKSSTMPWSKKYIVLPLSRCLNRIFTGLKLTDVHNGFRILSNTALSQIVITQDRMAHNTEIIQQIKRKKLKFIEFPVRVVYHKYGQGISGGLKILFDLTFK